MATRRTRPTASKPTAASAKGWERFYKVVRKIPRGRVSTFGAVAEVAGYPRAARHVGYALHALLGTSHDVPWQRVLGKRAGGFAAVPLRDPIGASVQRQMLEQEGVTFDDRDRVPLDRYGWPKTMAKPLARPKKKPSGPAARR